MLLIMLQRKKDNGEGCKSSTVVFTGQKKIFLDKSLKMVSVENPAISDQDLTR